MFDNLERLLLGTSVQVWLNSIRQIFCNVLFVYIADQAAANIKLMKLVKILVCKIWAGMSVLFWYEACALHRGSLDIEEVGACVEFGSCVVVCYSFCLLVGLHLPMDLLHTLQMP
jgi:hypothetical protein